MEVIDYLEPEWEKIVIKIVRGNEPVDPELVAELRAVGKAMGWLKSRINSELQPVDNSIPGDLS